jgi:hypothetical protein
MIFKGAVMQDIKTIDDKEKAKVEIEFVKKDWQKPTLVLMKNDHIQSGTGGGLEASGLWSLS